MKKIIDHWTAIEILGEGGNAFVYKVQKEDRFYALKCLKSGASQEKINRFKREANFADGLPELLSNNIILPFIEKHIDNEPFYYVIPLATPLKKYNFKNLEEKCDAIIQIINQLMFLHNHEMAHRDIKPENILIYKGQFYLSDFGLLLIKEKERITPPNKNEKIGAQRTIAPEMERSHGFEADPFKADIYSLAKTVWMILTEDYDCFEGQYIPSSNISLKNKGIGYFDSEDINKKGPYLYPLDILLEQSTNNDPQRRPTTQEFLEDFRFWIEINSDFHLKNNIEWIEIIHNLFPVNVPSKIEWTKIEDIAYILNYLCQYKSLAYLFLPRGGIHYTSAKLANENGFIEIDGGIKYLFPAKSLTFYSIGSTPEWSFFRLDFEENISPIFPHETSSELEAFDEELTELSPGEYAPPEVYEYNEEYNGYAPRKGMRRVFRFYKGSCVLFNTRSPYNLETGTANRHILFTKDEFEYYIQCCYEEKFNIHNFDVDNSEHHHPPFRS